MKNYVRGNKAAWEEAFDKAEGYGERNVERLKTEEFPFLTPEFVAVLKDAGLKGGKVAQFMCNNGRELLSVVKNCGAAGGVGFDIAENMVAQANRHAAATGIDCAFVATDVLKVGRAWEGRFDAAFLTVGALCWIERLDDLFEVVRRCLKPGGILLIHEMHPFTNMLAVSGEDEYDPALPERIALPYFRDVPFVDAMGMHYMVGDHYPSKTFTSFAHTTAELLTALIKNRFSLASFSEHPVDVSDSFKELERFRIPLSYILTARAV
ncbi:MAG: class I SAM-dependent methyltransferase [Candidatus Izemoplasmatales bacterium]